MFSRDIPEEQWVELRMLIAQYFMRKAAALADQVTAHWTEEDFHQLLHTHERTPYNPKNGWFGSYWNLIEADPDDNKFVDCAIAGNATFIVSEDRHFRVLSMIDYPKVNVIGVEKFREVLEKDDW